MSANRDGRRHEPPKIRVFGQLSDFRPSTLLRAPRARAEGRTFGLSDYMALVLSAFLVAPVACRSPQHERAPLKPATRIVSLVPAATEILYQIGAGTRIVAVSSFDHFPAAVEKLPRVGALLDPDVERIIGIRPDLVVLFEGQVELADKLRQAGIDTFPYPRPTIAGILGAIRALGGRVGMASEADREARSIEQQLEAIRRSASGRPPVRTLLVIGREPGTLRNIYASGGYGFLNEMLAIAGGANVFADVRRENLQVTTEAVLAARPDAIVEVVASRPWAPADIEREIHVWDALASLPAVRNRRISLLVGDEFVTPGPRIVDGTRKLAAALARVPE